MWAGQAVELDSSPSFTKACCFGASNCFRFQLSETCPVSDWFKWSVPNLVWGPPGFFLFCFPLNYLVFPCILVPRFLQGTSCFSVSVFLHPLSCRVGPTASGWHPLSKSLGDSSSLWGFLCRGESTPDPQPSRVLFLFTGENTQFHITISLTSHMQVCMCTQTYPLLFIHSHIPMWLQI